MHVHAPKWEKVTAYQEKNYRLTGISDSLKMDQIDPEHNTIKGVVLGRG